MRAACGIGWRGCSATPRASQSGSCISAIAPPRFLPTARSGAQHARLRGHEFHYASLTETGNDAPLAELTDGEGNALGIAGGRRGSVSGTFFHVIAEG